MNIELTKEEKNILRERFLKDYAKKKGWNHNNLSPNQMLEVISQKDYKSPKIDQLIQK